MLHKHSESQKRPRSLVQHHHHHPVAAQMEEANLLPDQLHGLHLGKQQNAPENQANHLFSSRYTIPKNGIPEQNAYDLIHNELTLDGNPHLNLASFVNTETTTTADKLIGENINKNLADNDEYPQLIELTQRCISMLAQLWKCDNEKEEPIGCATTGSSEAIMLGGLAMKKKWEHKMQAAGKSISKPNIIMSSACQVALEKFARYFEVECRLVPVSKESHHSLDPKLLWDYVDENTVGVFVILGTTYTGHLENVEQVADTLRDIENGNPKWANSEIPIHVDGASGGFIVPFAFEEAQLRNAKLDKWGFNHPRVMSINTSGHKFGLTTPGLGWVLWRDEIYLSNELRFKLKYLGGVEETFGLNFSRPGFQVIHQYYNFVTLGHEGYKTHFNKSLFVARAFSYELLKSKTMSGYFEIVSSIHEKITDDTLPNVVNEYWESPELFKPGVPLVAFKLSTKFHELYPEIPQAMLSNMLRNRGWIIPNYPLPHSYDKSDQEEVLRVVVRSEMKLDLAQLLLIDIENVVTKLIRSYETVNETAQNLHEAQRCDFIYKMLLVLASPDSEQPPPEKIQEEKKSITKNYRGTC